MSRLDSLPPDLRAVLSLLLRQRKRHAEVAAMLGIQERAVHDRAHAALALLAPRQARALSAEQRERLGEYLLDQQDPAAQRETRAGLEDSASERAWAHALAAELAPLAVGSLPLIPAGRAASVPARIPPDTAAPEPPASAAEPPAPTVQSAAQSSPAAPSSRRGGAIVLGVLAAIVIAVVLLVVGIGGGGGGGGGSHTGTNSAAASHTTSTGSQSASTGTSTGASTTSGTSTTGASGTGTSGSQATHGKALTLTPPAGATSKAVGVAYVLTQKGQHAFYLFAKYLPALPAGTFYAVWIEGSSTAAAYPLGSLPAAGSNGLVEGGGPLPSDASVYTRIIITSETSHHPTHPGPVALGGAFTLG